jgi:glutathione S-transferase
LIAPGGPIARGGAWSLADFHLAPMIALFVIAADGETSVSQYPKLSAWWNEIRERSSLRDSNTGLPKPRPAANQ